MWHKFAEFVIARRWLFLALILLVSLAAFIQLPRLRYDNRLTEWIPKDDAVLKVLLETGKTFGSSELVLVVARPRSGDTFSRASLTRIKALTQELHESQAIFLVTSIANIPYIDKLDGGIEIRDFLEEVPESADELARLKAYALSKENYTNHVVSSDGRWLGLAVYMKPDGDPIAIFRETLKPLIDKHLKDGFEVYYSGIPSDAYHADEFVSQDLSHLVPIVVLLIVAVLIYTFGSVAGVLFPLLVVGISSLWVFGLMGSFGKPMNLITPSLPVLLVALGTAYAIHILNRIFLETDPSLDRRSRLKSAMAQVTVPVLLAAGTTLAGFLSFLTTKVTIVRDLGLLAGWGIFFALLISLTGLPAGYAAFVRDGRRAERKTAAFAKTLNGLSRMAVRSRPVILILSFVLTAFFAVGIPHIRSEVNFSEYYPEDSVPRRGLKVVQENFGGAYPFTFYLKTQGVKDAALLRVVRRAGNFIYGQERLSRPFSIADYIQEMNSQLNDRYQLPDTNPGVGNLWFFIESRDELRQLLTKDEKECLILAKTSTAATPNMRAIQEAAASFLQSELSRPWEAYDLASLEAPQKARVREAEARFVLQEIAWLARHYGDGADLKTRQAEDALLPATVKMPSFRDTDVRTLAAEYFKEYLMSEGFDFALSAQSRQKLLTAILSIGDLDAPEAGRRVVGLLKRLVPPKEFDEEFAENVASTLAMRVEEAKSRAFMERAWAVLLDVLPEKARGDENFREKAQGLLFEVADNLAVLPRGALAGVPSSPVSLEQVEQSGSPAALARLDHFLFVSQMQSLGLALVLVFVLMVVLSRSFVLGAVSMVPIVITITVTYGFLGFARIPLDYATMMIAGVSFGVGIDYTIHFVHGVRVKLAAGASLEEAVHLAFLDKGKAILANSVSVLLGFLVLLFSSMSPLRHFGGLMAASMFLAALAALTTLPALLLWLKPRFGGQR